MYKGLDVITAKATKEERVLAQHHLVDVLSPHEEFTVTEYRNTAIKIVSLEVIKSCMCRYFENLKHNYSKNRKVECI